MKKLLLAITALSILVTAAYAVGPKEYRRCASCHGPKGEKPALGVSPALKGQSKQELIDKMKGYQNKTYGGKKKSTMWGQVKKLTDKQIEDLADYISHL